MHDPKSSKKFIGFIITHGRLGNCQMLETKVGEGTSQVQLCKGLKLIDSLHLRTLIQMDSTRPHLFSRAITHKKVRIEHFLLRRQIKHVLIFPREHY